LEGVSRIADGPQNGKWICGTSTSFTMSSVDARVLYTTEIDADDRGLALDSSF